MARRLLAAVLALALGTAQAAEWVVEGRVVGVSDGDTITVLDDAKTQHKVRFAGIDAPGEGPGFRRAIEAELIGARVPEARRGPVPQEGQVRPRGLRGLRQPT